MEHWYRSRWFTNNYISAVQFIKNIPEKLDENAIIDGASLVRIYRHYISASESSYGEAITSYTFHSFVYAEKKLVRVSTSIMCFASSNQAQWNYFSSIILTIIIPSLVLYLLLQSYIFAGLPIGGEGIGINCGEYAKKL
ncbi:hypothetical protein NST74_07235 [Paenibacillus sp. FSL F4-0125]|uniref:hypothetical protein n=1 Tax=Paenibacillus sp. FSL F4-0125 TaxID=2954730 RepID=UPI0030F881C8